MKETYIIVRSTDIDAFLHSVRDKISQGYVCQGGLAIKENMYLQSMILIKK